MVERAGLHCTIVFQSIGQLLYSVCSIAERGWLPYCTELECYCTGAALESTGQTLYNRHRIAERGFGKYWRVCHYKQRVQCFRERVFLCIMDEVLE